MHIGIPNKAPHHGLWWSLNSSGGPQPSMATEEEHSYKFTLCNQVCAIPNHHHREGGGLIY